MDVRNIVPWGRNRAAAAGSPPERDNPFFALHRQMDRLFDDFFRDLDLPVRAGNNWFGAGPNVDVSVTDKEVRVAAELPGLDEKDIEVTWQDGILTLKGEKKGGSEDAAYRERWYGRFERALQLGSDIDPDKVQASFDKGVLNITLQKRLEAQRQAKRIAIGHSG